MKSLYIESHNNEMIARINSLSSASQAKWGKMNVEQAMVHCQKGFKSAYGDLKLKRGLIGLLFGKMAKKSLTNSAVPFKQNLPTDKAFIITEKKQFEEERAKLIELVKQFSAEKITRNPHPFFGKMTEKEWDILQWKHLDHHLRQFGA